MCWLLAGSEQQTAGTGDWLPYIDSSLSGLSITFFIA
jgi:hypothetical protein